MFLNFIIVGYNEDDIRVPFITRGVLYDRLYTGLSEGLVEIERVQGGGQAKGKLTHEVSVQISYGAFSVDLPTLVIGNASARIVFLSLGIDEDKERRAS